MACKIYMVQCKIWSHVILHGLKNLVSSKIHMGPKLQFEWDKNFGCIYNLNAIEFTCYQNFGNM